MTIQRLARLPVRPSPVDGEALDSYLERLAGANHLSNPVLLGMLGSRDETAWLPLNVGGDVAGRLATLSGRPVSDHRVLTPACFPATGTDQLLGGDETSSSWRRAAAAGWAPGRGTQLCPACRAEGGAW